VGEAALRAVFARAVLLEVVAWLAGTAAAATASLALSASLGDFTAVGFAMLESAFSAKFAFAVFLEVVAFTRGRTRGTFGLGGVANGTTSNVRVGA